MTLDLPLIWAGLIATSVLLYVMLDGFDLGVGILFPFARSPRERDAMMNSIAPYWDGNETWLVLGGGGLFAAFPMAYAIIGPALYAPIMLMLLALILRGVAFEFRSHGRKRGKAFWTAAFAGGSLAATLAQGLVLGGFIQGIAVRNGAFAGGAFDWLTPYSLLVAVGLVAGYALLGATWVIWRSEGLLHDDARRWATVSALASAGVLATVSVATLVVHPRVASVWGFTGEGFRLDTFLPHLPIPLLGAAGLGLVAWGLWKRSHHAPFIGSLLVFLSGYIGLAASFFPNIVPYDVHFRTAANEKGALGIMLVGISILLPVILGYTAWVYWIFRGKVAADAGYH